MSPVQSSSSRSSVTSRGVSNISRPISACCWRRYVIVAGVCSVSIRICRSSVLASNMRKILAHMAPLGGASLGGRPILCGSNSRRNCSTIAGSTLALPRKSVRAVSRPTLSSSRSLAGEIPSL